jgi:hypothetical protein
MDAAAAMPNFTPEPALALVAVKVMVAALRTGTFVGPDSVTPRPVSNAWQDVQPEPPSLLVRPVSAPGPAENAAASTAKSAANSIDTSVEASNIDREADFGMAKKS